MCVCVCVCVCVCLIVQNVSECVCVVNPIVSKMSDIISKKIKVSKITVSNLRAFNYCDTLSNMYSVF